MGPQFVRTPAGEELVVLSRRAYDVLLARLGDEEAEDRLLDEMADTAQADLASGRDFLLPVWFSDRLIARHNPVRIVREHGGRTLEQAAQDAGIAVERLRRIEDGDEPAPVAVLDAVSEGAGVDPRILQRMGRNDERETGAPL